MPDWRAWHRSYDDPESSLARRLAVVQTRLNEILDETGLRSSRVLALCAGDGRDLIPVLASRSGANPVHAVLVEVDEELAAHAGAAAATAGVESVEVRNADAGDPASFRDVLPVDLLMLCGIFGNVEHASVREVVTSVPAMVSEGGYVIWTRGADATWDPRRDVRRWFAEAGMPEVSFDGAPETYGVGVNRIVVTGGRIHSPRLFTFRSPAR